MNTLSLSSVMRYKKTIFKNITRHFLVFYLLACSSALLAQKQFYNGLSIDIGTEYIPEQKSPFVGLYNFTNQPNYGIQLSYERRFGRSVSAQVTGAYLFASAIEDINFRDDQGNLIEIETMSTFQRAYVALLISFWVVETKKYAFTPGLGVQAGQTFMAKITYKDASGNDFLPPESLSLSNNYINAEMRLTNRFALSRLRSAQKGTHGALHLLISPTLLYNLQSTDVPDNLGIAYELPAFGGGFWLGLLYAF